MQAWDNFLLEQEAEIGPDAVNKWLKPIKVVRFDARNLYLEASDSFQINWFEEHIRGKAQNSLVNQNHKQIRIHISLANQPEQLPKTRSRKNAHQPISLSFSLIFDEINPVTRFENFVTTENNLLAHKLLSDIGNANSSDDLGAFNPVFIYGPSGVGKSHLLMALTHALRKQKRSVIYTRADTFTDHVVSAIRGGEMRIFRQAYRNIDTLIIDDVHIFARKAATQEELFHTFNSLHMSGKQIVLAANCSPAELTLIEPRLVSRFEWGIVLPLQAYQKEEIAQVLAKKAEILQFPLSPRIAEFLLETFKSSTKALMRALEALILRSHMKLSATQVLHSALTIPMVKQHLYDLIAEEQQAALTAPKINNAVAEFFGIKPEDILGKAQTRECVLPRQLSMYLCRTLLNMPFTKLGEYFNRDHSTVMTSVNIVKKAIEEKNSEVIDPLNAIAKRVQH